MGRGEGLNRCDANAGFVGSSILSPAPAAAAAFVLQKRILKGEIGPNLLRPLLLAVEVLVGALLILLCGFCGLLMPLKPRQVLCTSAALDPQVAKALVKR